MNDEEKVLNSTILDPGVAEPISVSKEEALKLAHEQKITKTQNIKEELRINDSALAEIKQVAKNELDEEKVNKINDLMKDDYVKLIDVKYSKKTYIILIGILILIIGVIVFELIYFGNK